MKVTPFPADTNPKAAWVQIDIFRRMSPRKRLRTVFDLNDSLRATVAAGVRSRHPELSPEKVKLAVIRLSLGDELFRKVYPDVDVPR